MIQHALDVALQMVEDQDLCVMVVSMLCTGQENALVLLEIYLQH